MTSNTSILADFAARGLWRAGQPLRLHLGCGMQRMDGYINVDYPSSQHNVMTVRPDYETDILDLDFPPESVDEVRLHHVFEHFSRVRALALLIRWHQWLKPGGTLLVEVPDAEASARDIVNGPYENAMRACRQVEGDQSSAWGYHIVQWFPERLSRTLLALGYQVLRVECHDSCHQPPLRNLLVEARRTKRIKQAAQLDAARGLLRDSLVHESEQPILDRWQIELEAALSPPRPIPSADSLTAFVRSLVEKAQTDPRPIAEVQGFNQLDRDAWIRAKAATLQPGARVIDIGAGSCRYHADFHHCTYVSADFKACDDAVLGWDGSYGKIDHVCDLTAIPEPDASFDAVVCTEVLEHVERPDLALMEMARLLKPGGRAFVTAPLGCGLHQEPHHYYGGFTPHWYRKFGAAAGLEVVELRANGGFFKLLAQECARVAWTMDRHDDVHGAHVEAVGTLFGQLLPRFLSDLDAMAPIEQFTVGYFVELVRMDSSGSVS